MAFTTAYFELHNCYAWASNFQLQSNIVMARYGSPASNYQPLQSLSNNNLIETTTPLQVVYIIVTPQFSV